MMRWFWLAAVIVWGAGTAALAPAQALYSDSFTGEDFKRPDNWQVFEAPPLDQFSEDKYWFLTGGAFSTGNGDYTGLQTDGWSFAVVTVPGANQWSDYTVRSDFRMTQRNGAVGLAARWQDSRNHYRGWVRSIEGLNTAGIERVQNNNVSVLATAAPGVTLPRFEQNVSPLDRHILALTVQGSQITLTIDGQVIATAQDTTFTRGTAGLAEQWNLVYFDNFAVEPPGVTSATVASTPSPLDPLAGTITSSSVYRIVVARGIPLADAQQLKQELTDNGYTIVDIVQKGNLNDVLVGVLFSQQDAEDSAAMLRDDGFTVVATEQLVGDQAAALTVRSVEAAAPAPAVDTVTRVVIQEYPDQASAQTLKNSLDADGYLADIAFINGLYGVYLGRFGDTIEAQKLADALQEDGYMSARPITIAAAPAIPSAFVPGPPLPAAPPSALSTDELREEIRRMGGDLTPAQTEQIVNILSGAMGPQTQLAEEIQRIRQEIRDMRDDQQVVFRTVRERIEERATRDANINRLFAEVDLAQDRGNFDQAGAKLDEILQLDPNDQHLRARVDFKRNSIATVRERPTGQAAFQDAILEGQRQQIDQATREAETAENEGDLAVALTYWTQVLNLARDGSYDKNHARQKIQDLREKISTSEKAKARKEQLQLIILGVVGLVVILLFVGLLLVWRSKRNLDKQLLEKVQELTVHPILDPRAGQTAAGTAEAHSAPAGMMELGAAPIGTEPTPAAPPAKPAPAPQTSPPPVPVAPPETASPPAAAQEDDIFAMPSFDRGEEEAQARQKKHAEQEVAYQSRPEQEEVTLESFSFEDAPTIKAASPEPNTMELETEGTGNDSLMMDLSGLDIGNVDFGISSDTQPPAAAEAEPPEAPSAPVSASPLDALDLEEEIKEPVTPLAPPVAPAPPPVAPPAPKPAAAQEPVPKTEPESKPAAAPAPMPMAVEKPAPSAPAAASTQTPPGFQADLMAQTTMLKKPAPEKSPTQEVSIAEHDTVDTASNNVIYRQAFNDEEDGKPPRNWAGSYDYASLVITSDKASNGSDKCMKFEKKTGAGSAYYSCHFPNAEGKVCVEFDICCDNKNKYLLGFYVEKDKDFRKSIHTIVHRTATATHPTLRIQGEPIEYTLGEWRHIKYVLDLGKGYVDGFVDGQLVADHVKLENVPEYVNTLAIRDNLPTTGVLRVDNIVISKIS